MPNYGQIEKIVLALANELGLNYDVYFKNNTICVIIPDSDDKISKTSEIVKLIQKVKDENLTDVNLVVLYIDEEETGSSPSRLIIDLLKNNGLSCSSIANKQAVIEITLEDNGERFVRNCLLIKNILSLLLEKNPIKRNEAIKFRIKVSYRDFNFSLMPDDSIFVIPIGKLTQLEAAILYKLCNGNLNSNYSFNASEFGVSQSDLADSLENLVNREMIEVNNFDFNSVSSFYNERELQENNFPDSYSVKLIDTTLRSTLHE
jgi:hypothetical protein